MIYLVYFLSVVERTSFRKKNKIIEMVKEYFSLEGYCDFFHKNYLFCSGDKCYRFIFVITLWPP